MSDDRPSHSATSERDAASAPRRVSRLFDRAAVESNVSVVVAATAAFATLALVARLYALGFRVFHYDETWVGFWILRFTETGVWEYSAIVHGPFYARVNAGVFALVGASDLTARLAVAVIGGLLPLAALLFRGRLRDDETVALAGALALNPVLVYYSRFMRFDLPLAAFALVTLGCIVRAVDDRDPRYVYAGAVAAGLAFTTKESVLLYVATWIGAGALLVDYELLRARDVRPGDGSRPAAAAFRDRARRTAAGVRAWWPHLVGALLVFLAVVVFFYAPRSRGLDRPGFWTTFADPTVAPAVVSEATLGSFREAKRFWVDGSVQHHPYLPYLEDTLRTLRAGAPAVVGFGALGFLLDRYAGGRPRDLVAFSFYGGVAAVLGYPLANNLPVPWSTVHAIVPLTIPAAVGLAWAYRRGRAGVETGDHVSVGLATLLLAGAVVGAAATTVQTSYAAPHDSPMEGGSEIVYYSQPPEEFREVRAAIRAAAASDGVDVLYVGSPFALSEELDADLSPPAGWRSRVPFPWYTQRFDATTASATSLGGVGETPPVVVTAEENRDRVARQLDGYAVRRYRLDGAGDRTAVVFVRRSLLDDGRLDGDLAPDDRTDSVRVAAREVTGWRR